MSFLSINNRNRKKGKGLFCIYVRHKMPDEWNEVRFKSFGQVLRLTKNGLIASSYWRAWYLLFHVNIILNYAYGCFYERCLIEEPTEQSHQRCRQPLGGKNLFNTSKGLSFIASTVYKYYFNPFLCIGCSDKIDALKKNPMTRKRWDKEPSNFNPNSQDRENNDLRKKPTNINKRFQQNLTHKKYLV